MARPGAIVLRVILICVRAGRCWRFRTSRSWAALLLLWIGVKLLVPHEEEDPRNIQASDKLWGAVKTVIVADLVMSLDNVIAIAGAAESAGKHQMPLVIFGLLVSIPIIVWGSQIVIKLMDRFPIIITLGAHAAGLDRRADGVHRSRRQGATCRTPRPGSTLPRPRARCWCLSSPRPSRRDAVGAESPHSPDCNEMCRSLTQMPCPGDWRLLTSAKRANPVPAPGRSRCGGLTRHL